MQRRTFIQHAAIATSLAAIDTLQADDAKVASRIIDTHTHFYDPTRKAGVPWPGKGSSLYRPVYPKDWLAVAAPHGVTETVVVEASQWLEDNQWILDLAAEEKSIVGFVGNIDLLHVDFTTHIQRFSKNPLFRGIRIPSSFIMHLEKQELHKSLKLLANANLSLDLNGHNLFEAAIKLAKAYPTLKIIFDHVASAGDAAYLTDTWKIGIEQLGKCENIYCKVSALTEQTRESSKTHGSAPRETAYYAPILDHCWNHFGAERLIYGSNWPVCEKGGTYANQFQIVKEYFQTKGKDATEKYFWKNSLAAYTWQERATK